MWLLVLLVTSGIPVKYLLFFMRLTSTVHENERILRIAISGCFQEQGNTSPQYYDRSRLPCLSVYHILFYA